MSAYLNRVMISRALPPRRRQALGSLADKFEIREAIRKQLKHQTSQQ